MTAIVHEWCGMLHDPDLGKPCPCHAPPATKLQVSRRHRAAVKAAKGADRALANARSAERLWKRWAA